LFHFQPFIPPLQIFTVDFVDTVLTSLSLARCLRPFLHK